MYLNIAYTLLIADKILILLQNLYYMTNGITIPAKIRFYIWITVKVLRTFLLAGLIALHVITENFKADDVVHKIWIRTGLAYMCFEWPTELCYLIYNLYFRSRELVMEHAEFEGSLRN
jgi:hypothetical protein